MGINLASPVVGQFVAQHGPSAPSLLLNMASAQTTALSQADGARFLGLIVLLTSPVVLLVRRSAKAANAGAEPVQVREKSLSAN